MGMVDISRKETIARSATASGKIFLKKETIEKIKNKEIKKGDPLQIAEIAGINGVKKTPELIAHCHPIPIERIVLDFKIEKDHINAVCTVKANAKTGVEMEALVGVTNALNTIWDVVKYLEKDENGQFPTTKITDIRVLKKTKG
jgi:cyclic pyranopterin phosphate synthase